MDPGSLLRQKTAERGGGGEGKVRHRLQQRRRGAGGGRQLSPHFVHQVGQDLQRQRWNCVEHY